MTNSPAVRPSHAADAATPVDPQTIGLFSLRLTPAALVGWTIAITLVVRVVMAAIIGFGYGEGYYLASARHLALSYFDQPPLSLWIAHFALEWFGAGTTLMPRLPFILLFAGNTWLMYRLGARLFGEAAGAWAAVLLNLSTLFTISVGDWVQPDAPLFFFLTTATLPIIELCFGTPRRTLWLWILAGACFGLSMLSKYHAALVLAGLVIFVATTPGYRAWFLKPGVILAAVVATLVFSPVMLWNEQNHWVSFAFQGGRITRATGLRFDWLARSLGGQWVLIGLVIWPPMIIAFIKGLKVGPRDPKTWFLCCLAITPIIVFTAAAIWAPLGWHFHWQAPGYLFLFPLLGKAVAEGLAQNRASTRRWMIAATGLMVFFVLFLGSQATTGWLHPILANFAKPGPYYKTNPTRELLEWRPLRAALAQKGLLQDPNLFVVTTEWFYSGKADVAVGDKLPVVCLGDDPRNIAFGWDDRTFIGRDAVIVISSDSHIDPVAQYGAYFASITPMGDVDVPFAGESALTLHLYRAHDYLRPYPLPYGVSRASAGPQGGPAFESAP